MFDDQSGDDQTDDAHQFNQNVEGGAAGILEGIADSVADHSCGVSVVALLRAFNVTLFDGFLRIVPSTAGVSHHQRH